MNNFTNNYNINSSNSSNNTADSNSTTTTNCNSEIRDNVAALISSPAVSTLLDLPTVPNMNHVHLIFNVADTIGPEIDKIEKPRDSHTKMVNLKSDQVNCSQCDDTPTLVHISYYWVVLMKLLLFIAVCGLLCWLIYIMNRHAREGAKMVHNTSYVVSYPEPKSTLLDYIQPPNLIKPKTSSTTTTPPPTTRSRTTTTKPSMLSLPESSPSSTLSL